MAEIVITKWDYFNLISLENETPETIPLTGLVDLTRRAQLFYGTMVEKFTVEPTTGNRVKVTFREPSFNSLLGQPEQTTTTITKLRPGQKIEKYFSNSWTGFAELVSIRA